MILFDTDICVEILRGNTVPVDRRAAYADEVSVSFMTAAELYYGVYRSAAKEKNLGVVKAFLLTVNVIESDAQIEQRFGQLKAELSSRGTAVADADLLIAATALERCTFLVTGNTRHFETIPGLELRDWRAEA